MGNVFGLLQPEGNNLNDGDLILSLHESLISNILSRLATKDVVRTSILSKDWKYKWISSSSYSVNIEENFEYNSNNENFIKFMNKLLVSSQHLRSFHLQCRRTPSRLRGLPTSPGINSLDSSCFQTWVSAALTHNLEYLEVRHFANDIVYQNNLLNSASLKKIILGQRNGTLFVSSMNYAPNLTSLHIGVILEIVNENPNSSTVTFNFPVLETLTFRSCKWLNVSSAEIYAPSLTTFECESTIMVQDYDYSITIISPKLSSFSCSNGLPEIFILDGSSVVSAYLYSDHVHDVQDNQLCKTIGLRARNLLNGFTNLEQLDISSYIAEVSRLGPPLLRHEKLTRLILYMPGDAEQLFELLHAMPSLKFLTVNVLLWDDYDYEESVPSCIVSTLEEIEFLGFGRNPPEYDLAEFFLKTAKRLKKFSIIGERHPCAGHIKTVLSTFLTCSSTVEIYVRGN